MSLTIVAIGVACVLVGFGALGVEMALLWRRTRRQGLLDLVALGATGTVCCVLALWLIIAGSTP